MNKETQSIIRNLQNILHGEPWYGKPLSVIMDGVNASQTNNKTNNKGHSQNELLYHMISWAEFVLTYVAENKPIEGFENLDWPVPDSQEDAWQKGLSRFKTVHNIYHAGQIAYITRVME